MYGEMAASVSGARPWRERERDWDAALEGAVQFVRASGLDERTGRQLLEEATATQMAGVLYGWDTPTAELCARLAAEFRRMIRDR